MIYPTVFVNGMGVSLGLIMAIGAQNAHVIRCGLKHQHVGLTISVCILLDAALICVGVAGMGALIQSSPFLLGLARWGGSAFLLWYGVRSWRAVFAGGALEVGACNPHIGARQALFQILALSLLNPHVYLDTVVLLGGIGSHFAPEQRPSFALGAICVSMVWFCILGFCARRVSAWFARPAAWKWIDGVTGTTMLLMSGTVALNA